MPADGLDARPGPEGKVGQGTIKDEAALIVKGLFDDGVAAHACGGGGWPARPRAAVVAVVEVPEGPV